MSNDEQASAPQDQESQLWQPPLWIAALAALAPLIPVVGPMWAAWIAANPALFSAGVGAAMSGLHMATHQKMK